MSGEQSKIKGKAYADFNLDKDLHNNYSKLYIAVNDTTVFRQPGVFESYLRLTIPVF